MQGNSHHDPPRGSARDGQRGNASFESPVQLLPSIGHGRHFTIAGAEQADGLEIATRSCYPCSADLSALRASEDGSSTAGIAVPVVVTAGSSYFPPATDAGGRVFTGFAVHAARQHNRARSNVALGFLIADDIHRLDVRSH